MNIGNDDIRLFIVKKGFIPSNNNGRDYYLVYDSNLTFNCDLAKCQLSAQYPDHEYNLRNVFSPKDVVVHFTWKDTDDSALVIYNLENFFDKVLKLSRK